MGKNNFDLPMPRIFIESLENRTLLAITSPTLNSVAIEGSFLKYSLSWSRVNEAALYRVEWGIDGVSFPSTANVPATPDNPVTLNDFTSFAGESRTYRVRAIASNGEVSAPSNAIYTFGAPEDFVVRVSAKPDANGVLLEWPAANVHPLYRVSKWGYHAGFEEFRWNDLGDVTQAKLAA